MGQPPRSLPMPGTPVVEGGRKCERKTQARCPRPHSKTHTSPRHAHVCLHMHVFTSMLRQAGTHLPAHLDVKTMAYICIAPTPTFMSGAPLRSHLAYEEYCQAATRGSWIWTEAIGQCVWVCCHQTELPHDSRLCSLHSPRARQAAELWPHVGSSGQARALWGMCLFQSKHQRKPFCQGRQCQGSGGQGRQVWPDHLPMHPGWGGPGGEKHPSWGSFDSAYLSGWNPERLVGWAGTGEAALLQGGWGLEPLCACCGSVVTLWLRVHYPYSLPSPKLALSKAGPNTTRCLVIHRPMSTSALCSSMVTELLLFRLSRTSWNHPSFTSARTQNQKGCRETRDLLLSWLPHHTQTIDVTGPGRVAAATVTMDLRSHSPRNAPSTQPYHAYAEGRKQSVVSNGSWLAHELV